MDGSAEMSDPAPAPAGYRKKAVSGAIVTAAAAGSRAVLHVISIVVLARLLTPDDFGVMGMVFPIIAFATIFQEAGLSLATLQRERISDEELSTVFWLNAAIGGGLCLLLVVAAPLVAAFYEEPRVALPTAASGLLILFGALAAQHMTLLNRQLHFGQLALIDGLSLLLGTVLAIGAAAIWHTYWAIYLLSFGPAFGGFVLSWLFSGWRPGKRAPLAQVADVIRFGAHFTVGSVATYFGRNLDKVLIGRVWGTTPLGFYDRASKVVLMPILFVHNPLLRLVVPMLSQNRGDPERYRRMFLLAFQFSLLLTVPGIALLAGAAREAVALVMGPQWVGGARIFAWLAVACLGQLATGPLTMLFVSQDRPRDAMVSSVATSIYSSVAFVIGLPWGAVGVAMAYAVSELIRTPVMLWYATRVGPVRFGDMGRALVPFLAGVPLCLAVVTLLVRQLDHSIGLFAFVAVAGIAAYAVVLPCLLLNRAGREVLAEIGTLARSLTSRLAPAA
ncbi:lipopolysaccharide biosynthesis protein [Sphingomonas sp. BN140010]|uniref:Lipopolysaccharide biosynthesis protein n=1 Tax=Sphingomonas arvum TaxID=2992113 RepID=A0ABT3JDI6_9SPHN|nr:lipopolysaccharide biosynthesis protein [Sphingomonas sp. BN140010]MCW3797128.1 lipopolysaccharide biosynthesis protein [Sphingomonas sp. BN140010]